MQEAVRMIRFGSYNIRNVLNVGIQSALQGMLQSNVDIGAFQETKVTKWVYMRESGGYRVVATKAPSQHSIITAVF